MALNANPAIKAKLLQKRNGAASPDINPIWLVSLAKSKMMSRSKKDCKNPSRTVLRNIKTRQKALLAGAMGRWKPGPLNYFRRYKCVFIKKKDKGIREEAGAFERGEEHLQDSVVECKFGNVFYRAHVPVSFFHEGDAVKIFSYSEQEWFEDGMVLQEHPYTGSVEVAFKFDKDTGRYRSAIVYREEMNGPKPRLIMVKMGVHSRLLKRHQRYPVKSEHRSIHEEERYLAKLEQLDARFGRRPPYMPPEPKKEVSKIFAMSSKVVAVRSAVKMAKKMGFKLDQRVIGRHLIE